LALPSAPDRAANAVSAVRFAQRSVMPELKQPHLKDAVVSG